MNLALILLDQPSRDFAAVFTRNRFPGGARSHGAAKAGAGSIRGILINNKISNVGTPDGEKDAEALLAALGAQLGAPAESFFAASTGIIGWGLPRREMEEALPRLVAGLDRSSILPACARNHDH